ncbi:MAG TPA: HDOD domain-containing protein [Terracidiphilus sp.]|jgi:EAL and modified HD-GYP domain-containing signal transduction protein
MEPFSNDDTRPIRYATRQPILAADETVIGYKLLFRTDVACHLSGPDEMAHATIDMSTLLGLDVLCDHRLAFIGCNRNVLLDRSLAFLPPDRVVAEVERAVAVDDDVLDACCELKNAGYRIALDEFTGDDPRQALLHVADYVKVDLSQSNWQEVLEIVGPDHWAHSNLLATHVESREQFELARRAGFQFFQGYFFQKPESLRTRSAPVNQVIYLRLLQAVTQPEIERAAIEELIKSDPTLYFRLLRFVNSAILGIRGEVRTLHHAFTLIGDDELRRWCRLASIFEMSRGRPGELLLSALIRARFAEGLGERIDHQEADLFLVGLLSVMDAILEIPMSAVIEGLELDEDSTNLLLEHQGNLRTIFELVSAVETGAWPTVVQSCRELAVSEDVAAACYSKAIAWAQSLASFK